MASHSFSCTIEVVLSLIILSSLQFFPVSSFEFQVGEKNGWVVPPENISEIYNHWASENRFKVGDTLRFKYKKDSVMEVTVADYKKCNSTNPNFFSNTGNTEFKLDRPGFFYFISGASGHCDRGQRMIVRVMTQEDSSTNGGSSSRFKASVLSYGVAKLVVVQFVFSYFAASLF